MTIYVTDPRYIERSAEERSGRHLPDGVQPSFVGSLIEIQGRCGGWLTERALLDVKPLSRHGPRITVEIIA
jgi:hypothetical protein